MTVRVLDEVAAGAWSASWHGAVVVAVVLLVRAAAGRRLSAGWRCALWGLVAARLCMPVGPGAPVSLFRAVEGWRAADGAVAAETGDARVIVGYRDLSQAPLAVGADSPGAMRSATARVSGWQWLTVVWAAGVLGMLVRTVRGWLRLRRIVAAAELIGDPLVLDLLATCAARLGVGRRVRLVVSGAVGGPAMAGVWRPVILVPPGLIDQLSSRELSFVFLHELTHVKRWDAAVEWLMAGLTAVHWFNPMAWVAARLYRADRELARDAMVLRASSVGADERQGYGATLLRLVEAFPRGSGTAGVVGMVGMLWPDGPLRERVRRIAGFSAARRPGSVVLGAVAVALVGCSGLTDGRKKAPATAPASGTAPAVTTTTVDDGPADEVITRVYDVRDLLVDVPDFDSRQGFPGAAGSTRPTPPPPIPKEERAARLMTLIRETVDPLTWQWPGAAAQDAGLKTAGVPLRDRVGVIRELDGHFVATQRRSEQRNVVALLNQLREVRGITIAIQSRFIAIDKADFARLPEEIRSRVEELVHPKFGAGVFLTDAQVATLTKTLSSRPATAMLAAPKVVLFNGQRAYVAVVTQTAYVADLKPVRDKVDPAAVSYEPDVRTVDDGLIVDFEATISADRKYVTMTLNPRLNRLLRIDTVPYDKAPPDARGGRPTVQRPVVATTEIATTVSVPLGQTVLLATGGSLPKGARAPKPAATAPSAPSDTLLLMLARPEVIVHQPGRPPGL